MFTTGRQLFKILIQFHQGENMASNVAKAGHKQEFTPLSTLLIDDNKRSRFQHYLDEMHSLQNDIADLKNQYKSLTDNIVNDLNVSPKELKFVSNMYFNNSLDSKMEEVEAMKILLEKLQSIGMIG